MQSQTESNQPAVGDQAQGATKQHSHLFTVRLSKQEAADGPEYRGQVREVATGAFRNFREWADLASFMIERLEENADNARDRQGQPE